MSDTRTGADGGATSQASPAAVSVRAVTKRFGAVTAVDDVTLDIHAGEFFSLLGPSGSGKTTMLRMIAGFEQPTSGRVLLGGTDVTARPPFDRDVNTVFQDYALFPHMTVAQNVAYGLKVKRVPKAHRKERVEAALASVRLESFGGRKPNQLSGGQRQRVALARALVNRPRVLLLDEPLGALDRKLREEMQIELKQIQRDVGVTFVFVTHDQSEALTMSNRIALFDQGCVAQVGGPTEIYEQPASQFVAEFVGTSNLLTGPAARSLIGRDGSFTVRPEKIRFVTDGTSPGPDDVVVVGTIDDVQYLGSGTRYRVGLDDGPALVVDTQNLESAVSGQGKALGTQVRVTFRREHAFALETVDGTGDNDNKGAP
jgi:putative spermidine/putrescine transport system ATP-binding protein